MIIGDFIINIIDFIGVNFIWKYRKKNKELAEAAYNEVLQDTGSKELAMKAKKIKEEEVELARRMIFWNKISKLLN